MADSIADRKDESAIDLFWFKKGVFGIFEFTDDEIKAAESSNESKLTGICKLCKPVKTSKTFIIDDLLIYSVTKNF